MTRQSPPFCVQVEPTEGCPARCLFCGVNGIPPGARLMTVETARIVAEALKRHGWQSRIEFAMHGEPTLNPSLPEIIMVFREALPQAYLLLETNALAFEIETVRALFHAGLNTVAVDEYTSVPWAQELREKLGGAAVNPALHEEKQFIIAENVDYYEHPSAGPIANPHRRTKTRRLIFVAPIEEAPGGTHSALNSHCGAGLPPKVAEGKRCAKPFREFSVRWDGSVALCCNDWRGLYVIGNVLVTDIAELWQSPRMEAARRFLIRGERTFVPCNLCDALSYRVGLLPDVTGKRRVPRPTQADIDSIHAALAEGPLTEPVLRDWEKEEQS